MIDKKIRAKYAFELTKYIDGFRIPMFFSILINLIFKLLPLVIGVITSYMINAAIVGDIISKKTMFILVIVLVIVDVIFSYLDILVSHDMDYLKSKPELSEVNAIKNDKFIVVSLLSVFPSIQNTQVLQTIAEGLHPDCF